MTSPDEGPEWANEAHLDEVFATWVPGPPDSASSAEREMAGDNPRLEIPAEGEISDEDMEAALAAALAEAEVAAGPEMAETSAAEPEPEAEPEPSPPERSERAEPAGPSWLNFPEPEARSAPAASSATAPEPVFEPSPDQVVDVATSEAALESGTEPAFVAAEPEPVFDAEPSRDMDDEPEPAAYADVPAFEAPPPPEPNAPKRPWARSDDDILPGRKGKGRRR